MNQVYGRSVLVFGALAIVLGFAILVRTAYEGGGTVGYAVGALFVALGAALRGFKTPFTLRLGIRG